MYFYLLNKFIPLISLYSVDLNGKIQRINIMTAIQQIGQLIQQRRTHLNITQKQLADMANIGINTLYKIETGQANPTLDSLQRIADILGMEIILQIKKI